MKRKLSKNESLLTFCLILPISYVLATYLSLEDMQHWQRGLWYGIFCGSSCFLFNWSYPFLVQKIKNMKK